MVTMPTDEELTRAAEVLARVAESNTEAGAMLRIARRFAEAVAAAPATPGADRKWLDWPDGAGLWWVNGPGLIPEVVRAYAYKGAIMIKVPGVAEPLAYDGPSPELFTRLFESVPDAPDGHWPNGRPWSRGGAGNG